MAITSVKNVSKTCAHRVESQGKLLIVEPINDSLLATSSFDKQLATNNQIFVVVAHIYPPVTGQRQTLSCWTIRTLFITRTTS